jgi:hypothetical protein
MPRNVQIFGTRFSQISRQVEVINRYRKSGDRRKKGGTLKSPKQ